LWVGPTRLAPTVLSNTSKLWAPLERLALQQLANSHCLEGLVVVGCTQLVLLLTVLSTTSAMVGTPGIPPAMLLTSSRQQDGLVVVGCTQPVLLLLC
jgi:hypothetical protein